MIAIRADFDLSASILDILRHTHVLSWNVSGISMGTETNFLTEMHLLSGASICFLQEFGAQQNNQTITNDIVCAYVAPGLSKMSRSNCIVVCKPLAQFFVGHWHCPIGQIVCIKLGQQVFALLNLHVPHRKHEISLDQAIEMVTDMLHEFYLSLASKFGFVCKQSRKKIVWIMGGDLNQDIRAPESRSYDLLNLFKSFGLMVPDPANPTCISHTQRSDGSKTLRDWIGISEHVQHLCKHEWSQNCLDVCAAVDGITDSDHTCMFVCFDFTKMLRYNVWAADMKCQQVFVKNKQGKRVRKGWRLQERDKQSWQDELDQKLATTVSESSSGKITLSTLNTLLVEHAACHIANKGFAARRYSDSPELKKLCRVRRECSYEELHLKRLLTRDINTQRNLERKAFKDAMCVQLAHRRWDVRDDLNREIRATEVKLLPTHIVAANGCVYDQSLVHEWPGAIHDFWSGVFLDRVTPVQMIRDYMTNLALQVTALCMCLRLENTWKPIFDITILDKAINGLNPRRCQDESGLVADVLVSITDKGKNMLQDLFEERANNTDLSTTADDAWYNLPAILIEKCSGASGVDQFRPIQILFVLQKVYLRCLYLVISQYWKLSGLIQVGARSGHNAIEVIHVLRVIVEKCVEWSLPYVIVSIDLKKAFDSITVASLIKMTEDHPLPLRIKYALFREIMCKRTVRMNLHGVTTAPIDMQNGFRQGGPESSFLFAFVLSNILEKLSASWKNRGVGFGFGAFEGEQAAMDTWRHEFQEHLGGFDCEDLFVSLLAFMDDTYLIARSFAEAQLMLNELVAEFALWGLTLSPGKLKVMSEMCDCVYGESHILWSGEVAVERVTELKVLGGKITSRGDERKAYEHRISAAWAVYFRWKHVLESSASIGAKLKFWHATVGRSMIYNLTTTRVNKFNNERLAVTQRNMVRRMLRLKRQPICVEPVLLEDWIEWQKRSLGKAKQVIAAHSSSIVDTLGQERDLWARHISRFGWGGRPPHILKCVLMWRNTSWWSWQHFYNEAGSPFTRKVHSQNVGGLRRWEWHLPREWIAKYASDSSDSQGISNPNRQQTGKGKYV